MARRRQDNKKALAVARWLGRSVAHLMDTVWSIIELKAGRRRQDDHEMVTPNKKNKKKKPEHVGSGGSTRVKGGQWAEGSGRCY